MRLASASSAALIAATPVAAQVPPSAYVVLPLRSEIANTERVGPKKTGVFCGPAGSVTWAEAAPEPLSTARDVAAALSAAGLPARELDQLGETVPAMSSRLAVTVMAARIEACVPSRGMFRLAGGRRKLKAEGFLTLRWRVAAEPGRAAWVREVTQALAPADPTNDLPSLVRTTIVASALLVAAELNGLATP